MKKEWLEQDTRFLSFSGKGEESECARPQGHQTAGAGAPPFPERHLHG